MTFVSNSNVAFQLGKISAFALLLDQGKPLQVTKLMPLYRCIDDNNFFAFCRFILQRSYNDFLLDDSLSTVEFIPPLLKKNLFQQVLAALDRLLGPQLPAMMIPPSLDGAYDFVSSLGARKRFHVRAGRRTLPDPDLLLLEDIIYYLQLYWNDFAAYPSTWGYNIAALFCCDYTNYRLLPKPNSAQRVMDIIRFIADHYRIERIAFNARHFLLDGGDTDTLQALSLEDGFFEIQRLNNRL